MADVSASDTAQSMHLGVYLGLCSGAWVIGAIVAQGISDLMVAAYGEGTIGTIIGFWVAKAVLKYERRDWYSIMAFPAINLVAGLTGFVSRKVLEVHNPEWQSFSALITIAIAFILSCGLFALLRRNHILTGESVRGVSASSGIDAAKRTDGISPKKNGRPGPYQYYVSRILRDALALDLRAAGGFRGVQLDPVERRIFVAWMVVVGFRGLQDREKYEKAKDCAMREILRLLYEARPGYRAMEMLLRERFEEYFRMFVVEEGEEPGFVLMRTCRAAVERMTGQREPHVACVMAVTIGWWPAVTSYARSLVDLDRDGKVAW